MVSKKTSACGLALVGAMVFSWIQAGSALGDVAVGLDRQRVGMGEVFELKIRSAGASLGEEPDLSALGANFQVLARSRSLRTTVVNGHRDASMEWRIELVPLEPGTWVIPPLAVGPDFTDALSVTVVESPTGDAGSERQDESGRAIALIAEVDRRDPYVQEQVTLSLRLESGLPLASGALSEPDIPGAIVERLGEDRSESIRASGRDIHVFERRYAIFPQQSGELVIPASVFEGTLREVAPSRARRRRGPGSPFGAALGGSLFDDFFGDSGSFLDEVFGNRGRPVRVVSEPIVLAIRERPAQALGERWLPARDLELVEIWGENASEPPNLRVGEPVDRVVVVRARGVTASQLPLPQLGESEGLKQYTEPAYEDSQNIGQEMVALRALPTVLIPTQPGTHVLPEVEIEWWDTQNDRARVARLPARTLEVAPAPGAPATTASVPPPRLSPPASSTPAASDPPLAAPSVAGWGAALAGFLALLGLTGYGIWRWLAPSPDRSDRNPRRRLEKQLATACSAADSSEAEAALLALGRRRWPDSPPKTVSELARRLGAAKLEAAVMTLSAHRFARDTEGVWEGRELWQAYRCSGLGRRGNARSAPNIARNSLPELYPTS